jgi:hypothetical protein
MDPKITRRKANGVGAMLSVRYPAHEVNALDAAALFKGITRGALIYDAVSREVRRIERLMQKQKSAA